MVSIYTISDKTLMGKKFSELPSYISECFFKNNIKIDLQSIVSTNANFNELLANSQSKIFIFLVDKASTKLNECLANLSNAKIIENPYVKSAILDYYKNIGQLAEKECENEWNIPSLARAIINPNSTTQGYILEYKDKLFCVVPNNIYESRQIFNEVVLDYIISKQKKQYNSYTFKTFGLSESAITQIISEQLKNKDKVTINLFSKPFEVDIVIKASSDSTSLEDVAKIILMKLDKYIYAVEDVPAENVVYKMLKLNDIKVCFIEDITGGELAYRLTKQCNDAKNYMAASYILANNQSKKTEFDISEQVLNENNGLSANLVYELATKGIAKTNAHLVVCSIGKANGECFIAIGDKNEIHVYKNVFKGSYSEILDSITTASYFYLIKKLKKNDFHFEQTTV